MSGKAEIAINGERLSDEESHIVCMAVDTFRAVMAQGIKEKDEGITTAMTPPYWNALTDIQNMLAKLPTKRDR